MSKYADHLPLYRQAQIYALLAGSARKAGLALARELLDLAAPLNLAAPTNRRASARDARAAAAT